MKQSSSKVFQQGWFIALEGIDGCGKGRAAPLVEEQARQFGLDVFKTAEPTNGPTGVKIRNILQHLSPAPSPLDFQRMYVEDRYWHVCNIILPAVKEGKLVLSGRHWLSTLAYGMLGDYTPENLIELHQEVFDRTFVPPDITFLLDVPAHVAMERIHHRGEKREYFEQEEKLRKVRGYYLNLALRNDLGKIVVVDATQTPEEIANQIWHNIQPFLIGR